MKISVYVAIGVESKTYRRQYNRTNIYLPIILGGGWFSQFFEPLYFKNY